MKDQVLSIKQMRELRELCIDTSKASMYYEKLPTGSVYLNISDEYKEILFWTVTEDGIEYIPTLTLQDILEMLPTHKTFSEYNRTYNRCWVRLCSPENDNIHTELSNKSLLQAAFNMLKWCKQNNYI